MATSLLIALLGCVYGGFALLALSQSRNWTLVLPGRPYPAARAGLLKAGGWALLATALIIALVRDGPAFGLMLWVLMLAAGAALVIATLSVRRR
ncbi:DUF3325 domain-containing protein [Glacieibacterium frigidum]|uniref:DUF3325 domain-containing protein n=1 Tax=Glacieibacterium frigidum TaxID=2593303 RepID=UPI00163DB033|nr:DUF3325 domain-containing protein [Glacieibacterium frigidum]